MNRPDNKKGYVIKKQAYRIRLLSSYRKKSALFYTKKRVVAWATALSIVIGSVFMPLAVDAREGRDMSEIKIENLSEEEFMSMIEEIKTGMENHEEADILFSLCEEAYLYILRKTQNIELMEIDMNLDITVVYDNYAQENSERRVWVDTFICTVKALCENSEYEDACKDYLKESFEEYRSYEPMTEEENDLLTKIDTLQTECSEIKANTKTNIDGTEYNLATLEDAQINGEITEKQYYTAYYDLCDKCYDSLSLNVLTMIKLRNEFAQHRGYENYMEYAYQEEYNRDYTYEQARALREYLIAEWVPSFVQYSSTIVNSKEEFDVDEFTIEGAVEIVKKYLPMIDHTYRESISYAEQYHLWDLEERGEKVSFSFVQDLNYDQVPFLSIHGVSNLYDLSVFAHELGHYNADFHSSEEYWSSGGNIIDIAEIHSQGSELLLSLYYQSFSKSPALAQAYEIQTVEQLMLYASMMDGIEYDMYTKPNITAHDINKSYVNGYNQYFHYNIQPNSSYARTWVLEDLWYSSPCYYISYVVSGFTALNIFTMAAVNYQCGIDLYMDVVESDWKYEYLALVKEYNLLNPFDEEQCEFLAEKVIEQYENCIAGNPACAPYVKWKK